MFGVKEERAGVARTGSTRQHNSVVGEVPISGPDRESCDPGGKARVEGCRRATRIVRLSELSWSPQRRQGLNQKGSNDTWAAEFEKCAC